MDVITLSGNRYTYHRDSNKIDDGEEDKTVKDVRLLQPLQFLSMPDLDTFVICFTTKCNLRCSYCCYSGQYRNTRTHGMRSFNTKDVAPLLDFIDWIAPDKPLHIMFYGGESLLDFEGVKDVVDKAETRWSEKVRFSVSTNGTLLSPLIAEWAVAHNITLNVSVDGTHKYHDRYRKFVSNSGSFACIYKNLTDIRSSYPTFFQEKVNLLMTVSDIRDLSGTALGWANDELLKHKAPALVSIVAPNYLKGVPLEDETSKKATLYALLHQYEQNPENGVLDRFFEEMILLWNERQLFPLESTAVTPTCIPQNHKLYIDIDGSVGLCEKTCDNMRMGNIHDGIDWDAANQIALKLYEVRQKRCGRCPILRLCDICPTSLDLNEREMDVFCHNQIVKYRLQLLMFCEMAERGMLS